MLYFHDIGIQRGFKQLKWRQRSFKVVSSEN